MDLYLKNALDCSKKTTLNYSTSFSMGVRSLNKNTQDAIYAIYGFVRFADEIVDTFFDKNQRDLFDNFTSQTQRALVNGFSTNPILHSFQWVVNTYNIHQEHIDAFLKSMEMDLDIDTHDKQSFDTYVFGSAEAVGLMCLTVFCKGDDAKYESLVMPARKLGSAFQKINFLRDLNADYKEKGRNYFPEIDFENFNNATKKLIEKDIEEEFKLAYRGIVELPPAVRRGVLLAYEYYVKLLKKIKHTSADAILQKRYRISNFTKFVLLIKVIIKSFFM